MNLGKYVTLYKTLMLIQKRANGGKERRFDPFFAGLVGGYVVFGDRNAINEQVRVNSIAPPCFGLNRF
jgi:peroxisomal membrane protein 4